MKVNQLVDVIRVAGTITVETGLHIGGSQDVMEISGLDNPIIKNPVNAEPYIPGSSLKGRMRSLAEWHYGELPTDGEVTKPDLREEAVVHKVFGVPASKADEPAYRRGPTRLIVRDAPLAEKSRTEFVQFGRPLVEVKSENSINRLSSMANPRPIERVLPGVEFDLELLFRVFDIDGDNGAADRKLFDEVVLLALALVQADALGGGGSRGCGKVRFKLQKSDKTGSGPLTLPNLFGDNHEEQGGNAA
ncbi:type III-A CRISPR-associated RAMP protein Csm3 [Botrimarina hoheduenensis]|uniref:CRISPR system Cms endoribonuclease Csm3 n=1 Tax=Botrimarina hoheduenensis TaxID=2528000 RepID=A0A5C5VQ95_9BACT|nr:type III-A CRISPR-associated RAMP protein Csm3 [Botrimarina hoheduenensis]TWT40213.1 RAMP superfamily protein [Botrimarina hoheduenensis]